MNNFLNRDTISLDLSTRCTLACSKCWRDYHLSNSNTLIGKDMTISEYKKIISFFKNIIFCGQISDPVLHPKFSEFLKLAYENGNKVEVRTAVSHKPKTWYYEEAFPANPNAEWVFAIDGLPKDSHKYRVRQDGEKLFDIMYHAGKYGVKATWSCIVMSYNEDDLEEIYSMARDHHLALQIVKSSRWFEDDPMKPKDPKNYVDGVWRWHV